MTIAASAPKELNFNPLLCVYGCVDNLSMERKKRICSSITITRNFRGWITLDTLLAVKLWDKPNRNFGIAIDVQDQDDNALPAARFFQPTDCSEASKANGKCVRSVLFI